MDGGDAHVEALRTHQPRDERDHRRIEPPEKQVAKRIRAVRERERGEAHGRAGKKDDRRQDGRQGRHASGEEVTGRPIPAQAKNGRPQAGDGHGNRKRALPLRACSAGEHDAGRQVRTGGRDLGADAHRPVADDPDPRNVVPSVDLRTRETIVGTRSAHLAPRRRGAAAEPPAMLKSLTHLPVPAIPAPYEGARVCVIALAGIPTYFLSPGSDRTATHPAPSTAQSPTCLPGITMLPVPSSHPTPIVTFPDTCASGCSVTKSASTSSCATWHCMFTVTKRPIRTFTVTIAPAATYVPSPSTTFGPIVARGCTTVAQGNPSGARRSTRATFVAGSPTPRTSVAPSPTCSGTSSIAPTTTPSRDSRGPRGTRSSKNRSSQRPPSEPTCSRNDQATSCAWPAAPITRYRMPYPIARSRRRLASGSPMNSDIVAFAGRAQPVTAQHRHDHAAAAAGAGPSATSRSAARSRAMPARRARGYA